jgi:hypothetical protein
MLAMNSSLLNGGGGTVIIPGSKEIAHNGLTELIVVDSIRRKKK